MREIAMKRNSRQSGLSLIEVLVVIVVLAVGILTVIRLFPPGFLVNRNSELLTFGTRLAKQEIARYTSASANLMDAVAPVVPVAAGGGYAFQIDTDVTPDDVSDARASLYGADPYYFSNVNKVRRIMGETVRIPLPSPTPGGQGAVYVLSSGPFMDVNWSGTTRSIFISGLPLLRRIEEASDPSTPFVYGPSMYAIDYNDGKIAFAPVPYDREFVLAYSYTDSGNSVQSVVDQVLSVPAGSAGWLDLPTLGPVVPDSETCSRRFVELATLTAWSETDPYQFKMLSPRIGGATGVANVGVVAFNPAGRSYTERTPYGFKPLMAKIDYDVLDWRILHEDRPMPATGPYRVSLALKGIKRMGDYEADQSLYTGLFRDSTVPVDVLVYDLASGSEVPSTEYSVDYREGTIRFGDTFGALHASGAFRVYYKAHGDWSMQVMKAPSSLRRSATADVGFGAYFLGYVPYGPSGAPRPAVLFALTEAGKTINVRELNYLDASGGLHRVANASFRVNEDRSRFQTVSVGGAQRLLTWAYLPDSYPDAVYWPFVDGTVNTSYSEPVQPTVGVQGVSLRSRVMWNNGTTSSRTNGDNTFKTRWRKVDIDTFLLRSTE